MTPTETIEKPKRRRRRKTDADSPPEDKPVRRQKAKTIATDQEELNLLVDFQGVSIGDGTGRLGIKVSRNQLSLSKADRTLCGRRLAGRIAVFANGESPEQTVMFEGARLEITATFDVKRFSVAPDWYSFGLTFPLLEIDCRELAGFAKKQGRILVDHIETIPSKSSEDDEDI